jgi:hypothetical protein
MSEPVIAMGGWKMQRKSQSKRRGSSGIEFALSSLFWVPLLTGTLVIGTNVIKANQVVHLCRDLGHMWAYGVDFSQASAQSMMAQLAQGLSFNTNGTGNGVVMHSTITQIGNLQCLSAGFAANTTACPNLGQAVFTRRVVVGNVGLRSSNFGTPPTAIIGARGFIAATDYCTNTNDRANNFIQLLPLADGEVTSLTETYFISPELDWTGIMTGTAEYSYAIF